MDMNDSKIRLLLPKNLTDKVIDVILQRILTGIYEPGHRIDATTIVEELNVSRSPVKDALNKLCTIGAIDILPRIGHYVKRFSKREISDLFELRTFLEVSSAQKGLSNFTDDILNLLKRNLEKYREIIINITPKSVVSIVKLEIEFHNEIVELNRNPLITKIHENIQILSHIIWSQLDYPKIHAVSAQQEHQQIVEAFAERNPVKIEACIRKHFQNAVDLYI